MGRVRDGAVGASSGGAGGAAVCEQLLLAAKTSEEKLKMGWGGGFEHQKKGLLPSS